MKNVKTLKTILKIATLAAILGTTSSAGFFTALVLYMNSDDVDRQVIQTPYGEAHVEDWKSYKSKENYLKFGNSLMYWNVSTAKEEYDKDISICKLKADGVNTPKQTQACVTRSKSTYYTSVMKNLHKHFQGNIDDIIKTTRNDMGTDRIKLSQHTHYVNLQYVASLRIYWYEKTIEGLITPNTPKADVVRIHKFQKLQKKDVAKAWDSVYAFIRSGHGLDNINIKL